MLAPQNPLRALKKTIIMKYLTGTILSLFFIISTKTHSMIICPIFDLGSKPSYNYIDKKFRGLQIGGDYHHKGTNVLSDITTFYVGADIAPSSTLFSLSTAADGFSGYEIKENNSEKRGKMIEITPEENGENKLFFSSSTYIESQLSREKNSKKSYSISLCFSFSAEDESQLDKEIKHDAIYYSKNNWHITKKKNQLVVTCYADDTNINSPGSWYAFDTPLTFDEAASYITIQSNTPNKPACSVPLSQFQQKTHFYPNTDKTSSDGGISGPERLFVVAMRHPEKGCLLYSLSLDNQNSDTGICNQTSSGHRPCFSTCAQSKLTPDYSGLIKTIIDHCLALAHSADFDKDLERLSSLNKTLEALGFKVKSVPADHFCFYNAVAMWLNEKQPSLENSSFKEYAPLTELTDAIQAKRLTGKELFEHFKTFAAIITSIYPQDDVLSWAATFSAPVGIGIWADDRIITNLLIPLVNKPVVVVDTTQVPDGSYFRCESYYPGQTDPLYSSSIEDLVMALTAPDTIVLAHRLIHWEVILPES